MTVRDFLKAVIHDETANKWEVDIVGADCGRIPARYWYYDRYHYSKQGRKAIENREVIKMSTIVDLEDGSIETTLYI